MNTSIIGKSEIIVEQCEQYLRKINPNAPYLASIYKKYCDIYGIRLECAWVQMCLETNFLRYSNVSITTLDMNNYCGLGALDGNGRKQALVFATPDDGVRNHIQHLYAYCSTSPLPIGEPLVDSRFKYVERGCATDLNDLGNGKWASDKQYANKLINLLNLLYKSSKQSNKGGNNMALNIKIDPGHGCYPDTGAEGFLNEQNCALDIANSVITKLNALGHNATNIRPSHATTVKESLKQRCDSANEGNYLISIHLNASDSNGHGTEVYAMSEEGKELAQRVVDNLSSLGWTNRGVKDGSGLYVIKHSQPVAILVEICFVDNQHDAQLYNSLGVDIIANAIVSAILNKPMNSIPNISSTQNNTQSNRLLMLTSPLMQGEDITKLQQQLNKIGYKIDIDGYYGENTYNTVKLFQCSQGINSDGIVGKDTLNHLNNLINKLNEIKTEPTIVKYDETIPVSDKIFKIPNINGYIEESTDGRLMIHKDRGNYIAIGKGFIDLYWNDNNGNSGNKRIK